MTAVFRALFGYFFLIFMVRIAGRRPGKQATPFEYVLIFFMGGVTLTPLVGDDRSLTNAMVQILTVAAAHFLIAVIKHHSEPFGRLVDGTPLVLLAKGRWHEDTMKRMRIEDADVMAAARGKGMSTLDEIDYAILERNGEIAVLAAEGKS